MFAGFGTTVNVATVLAGSSLGLLLGHRLPQRTRDTVTDALGLVTLLIGALSAGQVTSSVLSARVGSSAPVLIVLGSLLVGGIVGSLLDIERRLEDFGGWLRSRLTRRPAGQARDRSVAGSPALADSRALAGAAAEVDPRARFIQGFVTASLVFCVGPLTILGSLADGLGLGADQLILKAVLDGFAAIAFAASLGAGVMASAVAVALIQGALTLVGFALGDFLPAAHLAAITATGGLLLLGVGLRLLNLKQVPVGNLLPALLVAPLLVSLVSAFR
ncbi:MAG: hypothetical protein JWP61_1077 [Friedmanniella sp.]|nr:hypothetical protein [Friedmanniella sp.]